MMLTLLQVERVERVSERVVPSVTERSCETTSRVSPSPLSVVSLDEVVSSVFLPVSYQSASRFTIRNKTNASQ